MLSIPHLVVVKTAAAMLCRSHSPSHMQVESKTVAKIAHRRRSMLSKTRLLLETPVVARYAMLERIRLVVFRCSVVAVCCALLCHCPAVSNSQPATALLQLPAARRKHKVTKHEVTAKDLPTTQNSLFCWRRLIANQPTAQPTRHATLWVRRLHLAESEIQIVDDLECVAAPQVWQRGLGLV